MNTDNLKDNKEKQNSKAPTGIPEKNWISSLLSNKLTLGLIFLALSLISVICFLNYNWIFGAQDIQFHLQRINELYQNVQNLNWFPFISTFNFNQNGSAVMSMYPKLPLYLYVIVRLLFQEPILSYYIAIIVTTFSCLLISYFSFLSIHRDQKVTAFLFSCAYSLSGLVICNNFLCADLGVSFSLIFFPAAFAGIYHWLKNGKYRLLILGLSGILLSNILNFVFIILTFVCLTLMNFKLINKQKVLNLLKSMLITGLLTSGFWLPAIKFGLGTKMNPPVLFQLNGINLFDYFQRALTNNITYGFTLVPVLGIVFGAIGYLHINRYLKQIYWFSIALILISSSLFPWDIFQNTPLKIVQFPWRLLVIPQLLLTYIFAIEGTRWLSKIADTKIKNWVVSIVTVGIVALCINTQLRTVDFQISSPEINYSLNTNNYLPSKNGVLWFKVTNNDEFNNLMGFIRNQDYLPVNSNNVFPMYSTHWGMNNDNGQTILFTMNAVPDGSNLTFSLSTHAKKLTVPFLIYNKNYQITLDSKRYPLRYGKNRLLYINNLKPGNHMIQVSYHDSVTKYSYLVMTVLGMFLTFYNSNLFFKLKKRKK